VGDLVSVEAAFALKQLIEGQGGVVECRTDGAKLPAGNRSGYVGTARVEDIDTARNILLVGTNPAVEAPVLNARIRKAWTRGADVTLVGEAVDLTYEYEHMGTDRAALAHVLDLDMASMAELNPLVIVGQGALAAEDGAAVLATVQAICAKSGCKMLVLHTAAGRVGAMDVGATAPNGIRDVLDAEVIYNLGADEGDIPAGPFVIYQGSHGDRGAHRADIILPGAAYTEEGGLFVNTEGRPQLAQRAGFAPGQAKENWAILRALSTDLGAVLPYDSLAGLRQALVKAHPHLGRVDEVAQNGWTALETGTMASGPFVNAIADFYLSNPIARASSLMAELSANAKARRTEAMAAQ
jgi:NADH-quinone oxidoreductase subunit G